VLAVAWVGCSDTPATPKKVIATSPNGPAQVLSAADTNKTWPTSIVSATSAVVPASFHQPIVEPLPVKPFTAWSEQEAAADALGRIGPAAVPSLTQALQNPDPEVRLKAVEVLGRMGVDAKDAVPHLVRLLDDPDDQVRKAATRTLGRIGPPAQEAVPALMRTLLQPQGH
jgi:HEAT repeat protein